MRAWDCLGFLVGRAAAIRTVARSRSAIGTGVALVLLTAIARNYDQTFILEKPVLWLLGPLLFSVVSGTWLYMVAYGGFTRRWMGHDGDSHPDFWSGWRRFLGVFWMTAPIAWLYAIPVERLFDSLTAARANVALLGVVSLWRVLLMARVLSVLCGAGMVRTLCWVLVPATVEVLGVFFVGGGLARSVLAGMGGMRNSPEEEVLLEAMSAAFAGAFLTLPVVLIAAMLWRPKIATVPLPKLEDAGYPWPFLAGAAVVWMSIAVQPQRELARSVHVEELVRTEQWRAALDYMSSRQAGDFAPSRTMPPKPYEREVFRQLPQLIGVADDRDAPWVRSHLLRRLDEMWGHFGTRGRRREPLEREEESRSIAIGLRWMRVKPADLAVMLGGLARISEGRAWLGSNTIRLEALASVTREVGSERETGSNREDSPEDWRLLAEKLRELGVTNVITTNASPR